jgi:hypothetical protein
LHFTFYDQGGSDEFSEIITCDELFNPHRLYCRLSDDASEKAAVELAAAEEKKKRDLEQKLDKAKADYINAKKALIDAGAALPE